jgi:predicted RNA-binding Zn ribbon-like protein
LVNTASAATLETTADLAAFVEHWGCDGERHGTQAELAAVRALRDDFRAAWECDDEGVARIVNRLLLDAHALPQLVKHDDCTWHLNAIDSCAPLANVIAVESAMALIDLVSLGELARLRVCAGHECDDVLVDLSRNRSRRYCEKGCGNRANVAAYRARQSGV